MTIFDAINLAGGIALFLYGMSIMGSGLEKIASGKMQTVLQKIIELSTALSSLLCRLIPIWISRKSMVKFPVLAKMKNSCWYVPKESVLTWYRPV